MYRYVGLLLLLGASGLFAEPCRVPRKRCTQVPVERISEELRKEMSRREDKRHPVSIALQDGTSVNGIVLGWSAAGIALGTPGTGTTIAPSDEPVGAGGGRILPGLRGWGFRHPGDGR